MKHSLNQTLLGSGAIASLLLSASLVSCQDEDYGYTQEEIHQSYLDRKYAEEFAKAFPNVDPNHTWMCAPDTFGVESLIEGALTRAYDPSKQIVITSSGTSTTTEAEALTILSAEKDGNGNFIGKLPEAQDNRGNVTQSFEYFAVKDYGDGYQEYTVTPMFWGRKFCDANQIGIYYIDNNKEKQLVAPFWSDQNSGFKIYYTDGAVEDVKISDQQINEDPLWANYQDRIALGHNCAYCGFDIYTKVSTNNTPTKIEQRSQLTSFFNHQCIEITSSGNNSYDTKLIIQTPGKTWDYGEDYTLSFKYWVSEDVDVPIQFQKDLYSFVDDAWNKPNPEASDRKKISAKLTNQWGWQECKIDGKVSYKDDINTIILCLNAKTGVKYRFKDIQWKWRYYDLDDSHRLEDSQKHTKAGKTYCGGDGKFEINHYELPQYKIQVPVGMKWGFYLKTKKQQNDAANYGQTWYSNSEFNEVTDKDGKHGFVSAAATYQVADPNDSGKAITYCCFEDAACRLHEYEKDNEGKEIKQEYDSDNNLVWNEGNCHCGYGHFDTDYNDIILRIVSDPVVVSSYKSLKCRVMCEDLGGTWDWDFNDIVYDVEYFDAENENDKNAKAKIQVKLQAVGGTLPVCMQFENSALEQYHISSMSVDNNSNDGTTRDLHLVLSNQTQDSKTMLYLPVNVPEDGDQKTIVGRDPQVVCTYTLNGRRFDDLDPRIFVDLIKIKVQQNPTSSNTTTTTVAFPTQHNGTIKTPECFMTSISTPWPNEHQKVSDRFPGFNLWVEGNANNEKWWSEGFGGGTTEVVTQ